MSREILGHTIHTISEMLSKPNVPQPYLVKGIIFENGKTVIVGKPKVGKSTLSIKIGISVAMGESLLGLKVNRAPVLFLEFDRRYLDNSIHEICADRSTEMMSIIRATGVALNEYEGYRLLLAAINDCYNRNGSQPLVIIDHKSACFAGKENEDLPNRKWFENLDKVNQIFNVTYLVICQAPKGWQGDIVDLPFGSRLLAAWADTIVFIQKPHRQSRRLEMASNYGEIEPITYTKDFQVIESDDIDKTKLNAAMTFVEEHWPEFLYPNISQKVEDTAEMMECSYSTVWKAYKEVKEIMKTREVDPKETNAVNTSEGDDTQND